MHDDPAHNLLSNEVPDLHLEQTRLLVLVQVHVDGEVGIDVAHLVLEALRDADDQIVDERPDRAERGNVFSRAMVDLNADEVLLGPREVDRQMAEVLGKFACPWQSSC